MSSPAVTPCHGRVSTSLALQRLLPLLLLQQLLVAAVSTGEKAQARLLSHQQLNGTDPGARQEGKPNNSFFHPPTSPVPLTLSNDCSCQLSSRRPAKPCTSGPGKGQDPSWNRASCLHHTSPHPRPGFMQLHCKIPQGLVLGEHLPLCTAPEFAELKFWGQFFPAAKLPKASFPGHF